MSLQKRQATHDAILSDLESRIREKHPNSLIVRNVTYGDFYSPTGEIDLLRIERTHLVMYEVKTGEFKYKKAQEQYRRFQRYCSELEIKGVYYHPKRCCRL
jgi:hypothetical protein